MRRCAYGQKWRFVKNKRQRDRCPSGNESCVLLIPLQAHCASCCTLVQAHRLSGHAHCPSEAASLASFGLN
eukprot:4810617-Pleurochrysis_carterae.AAC.1